MDKKAQMQEEEMNPMAYSKVFGNDKTLTFKPAYTGKKPLKQYFEEHFENKCYKANLVKK